jgi:hypothetical protein
MKEEKESKYVKIKPISKYVRGMNANQVKVLPGAKKVFAPIEDRHGNLVNGHTPDECKQYKFASVDKNFWKNYSISLTDTEKILDITREEDLLAYKFLKSFYPIIVTSESQKTQDTKYIMIDEEAQAEVKNKRRENMVKAMGYLGKMSETERASFLKLFGYKTKNMSPAMILDKLSEEIEKPAHGNETKTGAEIFIEKYDDREKENRILLESLLQEEILSKKGPAVYYGTDLIGATEDIAVHYFGEPSNQEMKINFIKMLKSK